MRHFDNQCTLIYWEHCPQQHGDAVVHKVNVKCFRNGRVQMTGVRRIEGGSRILTRIVQTLASLGPDVLRPTPPGAPERNLRASNYKVCLINSDFTLGIGIRREALHAVMCSQLYGLDSRYEPCIYPAVKVSFMWNRQKTVQDGVCRCQGKCATGKCAGSGNGDTLGACRRVTCAVFQSGCTIITGAHTYTQVEDVYSFICKVVMGHRDALEKTLGIAARQLGLDPVDGGAQPIAAQPQPGQEVDWSGPVYVE